MKQFIVIVLVLAVGTLAFFFSQKEKLGGDLEADSEYFTECNQSFLSGRSSFVPGVIVVNAQKGVSKDSVREQLIKGGFSNMDLTYYISDSFSHLSVKYFKDGSIRLGDQQKIIASKSPIIQKDLQKIFSDQYNIDSIDIGDIRANVAFKKVLEGKEYDAYNSILEQLVEKGEISGYNFGTGDPQLDVVVNVDPGSEEVAIKKLKSLNFFHFVCREVFTLTDLPGPIR